MTALIAPHFRFDSPIIQLVGGQSTISQQFSFTCAAKITSDNSQDAGDDITNAILLLLGELIHTEPLATAVVNYKYSVSGSIRLKWLRKTFVSSEGASKGIISFTRYLRSSPNNCTSPNSNMRLNLAECQTKIQTQHIHNQHGRILLLHKKCTTVNYFWVSGFSMRFLGMLLVVAMGLAKCSPFAARQNRQMAIEAPVCLAGWGFAPG